VRTRSSSSRSCSRPRRSYLRQPGGTAKGTSPKRSSGRASAPYFSRSRSALAASPARMSASLMGAPSSRHSR
jgi:hypothetical protein